jgi:serine protease Do
LSLMVGELQESKVAGLETPRTQKPAALAANRLGIVVSELSARQKEEMKLSSGLVVTEVKPEARADVRRGDVIVMLVHKGQHTELKSIDQLNKLLSGLDKNAVITLQVRRGDAMAFVTVNGLTDKG